MTRRVTGTTIDQHPRTPQRPAAPEPHVAPPREHGPIDRVEQDAAYAYERGRLDRLHALRSELAAERADIVARTSRYDDYKSRAHASVTADPVSLALGEVEHKPQPQNTPPSRLEQIEQAIWRLHEPTKLQTTRTEQAQRHAATRVALHRKPQRLALLQAVRDALQKAGAAIDTLVADDDALRSADLFVAQVGRPLVANPGQLGGLDERGGDTRLARLLADLDSEIVFVSAAGDA